MARWKVTKTRKAKDRGWILGMFGPSMGYQSAEEIVQRIREGVARYYVREGSWEAEIRVVDEGDSSRLVSTKDVFSKNNLLNLPDC